MANILKCKRCGNDIPLRVSSPKMAKFEKRTQRFCCTDCYETWWNEQRSQRVTRSAVAEKIYGRSPDVSLTVGQAMWLAALVDGEGSIGIWREERAGNRSGYRYRAVLSVANTNHGLLEAIGEVVPGSIQTKDHRANVRHKVLYQFYVPRRSVRTVLAQIAPFLIVKKQQADIVMQFCRLLEGAPMRTFQEHEAFAEMWTEMRSLNRRGR